MAEKKLTPRQELEAIHASGQSVMVSDTRYNGVKRIIPPGQPLPTDEELAAMGQPTAPVPDTRDVEIEQLRAQLAALQAQQQPVSIGEDTAKNEAKVSK